MIEIIKNLFKKEITFKVEYKRIKKPAKDEILIFQIRGASSKIIKEFSEMLTSKKGHNQYLVMNEGVEIYKVKRKKVKIC